MIDSLKDIANNFENVFDIAYKSLDDLGEDEQELRDYFKEKLDQARLGNMSLNEAQEIAEKFKDANTINRDK